MARFRRISCPYATSIENEHPKSVNAFKSRRKSASLRERLFSSIGTIRSETVSNATMGRLLLRLIICLFGVIVAVELGGVLLFCSITRQQVRIARQMMEDASQLQIGKSNLNDVLGFAHKYDGEATGTSHDKPCLESDCLITAAPDTNDFGQRHPKLGYAAELISRRGWNFSVSMWVKDGRLTATEQWFGYATPRAGHVVITTLSRPSPELCRNAFYQLHHAFAAYPSPHHFNVWVNNAATQEKAMLQLDLDCVLRVSGCKDIADTVPTAWKRYQADQRLIDAHQGKGQGEISADTECR